MRQLLVYPLPKKDQSVECYVRHLARENGFPSVDAMLLRVLGKPGLDTDRLSPAILLQLTGHDPSTLERLALVLNDRDEQPSYQYGGVILPSYQLTRHQRFCPLCYKRDGYMLGKWRIAWLPACTEHACELRPVNEEVAWDEDKFLDLGGAANDDNISESTLKVQQILEQRLEDERVAAESVSDGKSVVSLVDDQLFRCLGPERSGALLNRRAKYSRRYFPYNRRDTRKFIDCLYTQLIS